MRKIEKQKRELEIFLEMIRSVQKQRHELEYYEMNNYCVELLEKEEEKILSLIKSIRYMADDEDLIEEVEEDE